MTSRLVWIAATLLLVACGERPLPDSSAVAAETVRSIETDWNQAAQAKDVERFASLYAVDASLMAPNTPIVTGAIDIRATLRQLFAQPGFSLSLTTDKVVASRTGDLAYTQGHYSMTLNNAKGVPLTETGKYVVVFRKDANDAWRVVADIFNSDTPAPTVQ